jgi:hypothetical protein
MDSTWLDAGVSPANGVAHLYIIGPIDVLQPLTTPAPEPASLAVWGIGAIGIAITAAARRRFVRRQPDA